jgi:hypothetical protein
MARERFEQWVVLAPDGRVASTVCIDRVHETRTRAASAGATMARYADELAEQERQAKLGRAVSCDWDDYTWRMAYRRGWRLRKADVIVRPS